MSITDPWVLPAGVVISLVKDLPPRLREQMQAEDGDYAISRPKSRTPSKLIDSQAAALLKEFQTPKTIAQAVISYSKAAKTDPEQTLEGAFPLLQRMIEFRLLVPPGSQEAKEIQPSLEPGTRVGDFELAQCIQVLEDAEIYEVRRADGGVAALKILRLGCGPEIPRMLHREAAVLKRLDGSVNPALLGVGVWQDRPYLLLEWCQGIDAWAAASKLRLGQNTESRKELIRLCCTILQAYCRLHDLGVIHSDVHPRNILVDDQGSVKIVDYGLARLDNVDAKLGEPPRGGIGFFFEPEYAAAVRKGRRPPKSTAAAEQYSLAALLYSLLTGAQYLDFSLAQDEMMRQIAEDQPLPFSRRGIPPWPTVERILNKGLNKVPSGRFGSVSLFASSLSDVEVSGDIGSVGTNAAPVNWTVAEEVLEGVLQRLGFSGTLVSTGFTTAPKASVTYGAAGIAYALYRLGGIRNDAALLSLADVWCTRAESDLENSESYYNPNIEITPQTVGRISPYHTASGVHAVRALVSHALGDLMSVRAALDAFMRASKEPCERLDLTLGRSGTLLAASLLLDLPFGSGLSKPAPLLELGNDTMQHVWSEIDNLASIRECPQIMYLGIAHGWAGILYATMCWCRSAGADLPRNLEERLEQLAQCAETKGQGIRWPWVIGNAAQRPLLEYMPGWCNGSAGYVFLWTAAHEMLRDKRYIALAEKAAWNAWESSDSIGDLCCGLAGQGYAALNLYKQTGETIWLDRAKTLAIRAACRDASYYAGLGFCPQSLYKGEVGIALLVSDLSRPEAACMPFFEREGWPTQGEPASGGAAPGI